MKKKIIFGLVLLAAMAFAACTAGLAASIEGYSPIDFQIGLPTEAPAAGSTARAICFPDPTSLFPR